MADLQDPTTNPLLKPGALPAFSAVASGNGSTVVPEDTDTFSGGRNVYSAEDLARLTTLNAATIYAVLHGEPALPSRDVHRLTSLLGVSAGTLGVEAY